MIERVSVYCASSDYADQEYLNSAYKLGQILAENSITLVYGGGSAGLMGMVADGALSKGGKVIGIIPKFMQELEWGHGGISELRIVETMSERKEMMRKNTDAAIALPGGSGTFEELFETITMKRLGIYLSPIIIVNIKNFFNPCIQLLNNAVEEKFMDERNKLMWKVVSEPSEVINAIKHSPGWDENARSFASLRKVSS